MDARSTCANCGSSCYTIEVLRHDLDKPRFKLWLSFILGKIIPSHNWPSTFKKCVHVEPGVIKVTGELKWWSFRGLQDARTCNDFAYSNGLRREGLRRLTVDVMDPIPEAVREIKKGTGAGEQERQNTGTVLPPLYINGVDIQPLQQVDPLTDILKIS